MKKYFVVALLFASSLAYSQQFESERYFFVGAYSGSYLTKKPAVPVNDILNSIIFELEYSKKKEISFFVSYLYMFPSDDIKKMYNFIDENNITPITKPLNFKSAVTVGGRYYFNSKNINPFIQLGLSQEYNIIGNYSYRYNNSVIRTYDGAKYYKLNVLLGAGLNFKISRKIYFNFLYNIYQNIENNDGNFQGFSVYGGLSYNLF